MLGNCHDLMNMFVNEFIETRPVMLQWWATNLGWIKLMVCNMNTILENNHYCITITPGLCCKNSLKGQSCCQPYCSVVRTSLGKQRCIIQHFMKSHRQQSKAHRDWWGRRFSSEILGCDFSNVERKKLTKRMMRFGNFVLFGGEWFWFNVNL